MSNQLFRQEVIDNRNNRLAGEVSLLQPPLFSYLALLILLIVGITLSFLAGGNYNRKETVDGILQPDTGLLRLDAPNAGMVSQLLVEEGQVVVKGQPLLHISAQKHGTGGFELNQTMIRQYEFQISSTKQQIVQQQQKHKLQIQALKDEHSSLKQRLNELDTQSDIFNQRVKLNQQIVNQVGTLAGTGYISELEVTRQKDQLLSLDQQSAALRASRLSIVGQMNQATSQLAQLPIDQAKTINQLNDQIATIKGQLAATRQQSLSELRAPADGMVTGVLVKPGKSLNLGQHLLSILPTDSSLQAVIYVPTSAFGFIEKDQRVKLRYDAFPYQRFGVQSGQIIQVSANVILPEETDIPGLITSPSYRVVVSLEQQTISAYGKNMPLRSGMKLDADIEIESRSLLRWLFDPIFSIKKS